MPGGVASWKAAGSVGRAGKNSEVKGDAATPRSNHDGVVRTANSGRGAALLRSEAPSADPLNATTANSNQAAKYPPARCPLIVWYCTIRLILARLRIAAAPFVHRV